MSIWCWSIKGVTSNVELITCNVQSGRGGVGLAHGGPGVPTKGLHLYLGVKGCSGRMVSRACPQTVLEAIWKGHRRGGAVPGRSVRPPPPTNWQDDLL